MSAVPRVSVIVPNYNHGQYLPDRLESIQRQTFRDFELVLLDDASTDHSLDVLRRHAEQTGARLIVNERNSGSPFHQWNRGVQEARGEFVWIAESDDTAASELLETLVAQLEQDPRVGVASCDSMIIDESSQIIGPINRDGLGVPSDRWSRDFKQDGRQEIVDAMYMTNAIVSASGCVFRRQVYLDAGVADASFKLSGDYLQWCKLLLHSRFAFVARPLNFTRIHAQTQRAATANDGRRELETMRVQRCLRDHMEFSPELVRAAAQRQAISWLQGVRAGRYSGKWSGHLACFMLLWGAAPAVALKFLCSLPYCLLAWIVKRSRR